MPVAASPKPTKTEASAVREAGRGSSAGVAAAPPAYGVAFIDGAGDLEQEAERVAEAVLGMSAPGPGAAGEGAGPRPTFAARAAAPGLAARLAAPHEGALPRGSAPTSVGQTLAGPGRPLEASARAFMEPRFGHDFGDVRVHDDAQAAGSAAEIGALAYTSGTSIVFGRGRYAPETDAGRRLLAHELAHVVQQRGAAGEAPVQRFEAPIHEAAERLGLETEADNSTPSGVTSEEASAVYFGNWMRDVNQVFVPLVKKLVPDDVVFSMISYMAALKFGRRLTPEQFGYYIPAEHLDSPAGLVAAEDLREKPPEIPVASAAGGGPARPPEFVTPQESVDPSAKVLGAPLFSVDETGVIAYLRRSNLHIERRLELAARSGRNPEGFLHFGAALHALEDLFAHSNWIEIAVGEVLARDPSLLPELKGEERRPFTLGPSVALPGKGPRQVLLTGSFTSTDTQISITSEIVNFLERPLPPPKSEAEAKLKEEFVGALLKSYRAQLEGNPKFRGVVRAAIHGSLPSWLPRREGVAEGLVGLPVDQIYRLGTLLPPLVPERIKKETTHKVQAVIDRWLSTDVLQPLARRIQAEALGARVRDTSLLKVLADSEAQARGEFSAVELEKMQQLEKYGLGTVEEQKKGAKASGAARADALQRTPVGVVAGPSHSQIAKDHVNGPFFGIAFAVASVAVRRLREKMIAAWNERGGGGPFRFEAPAFPAAEQDRELFQAGRAKRNEEEEKSLARAQRIVRQGNEAAAPFDLAAMRHDSAEQVRAAAGGLRQIAVAPDKAADALKRLSGLLGGLQVEQVRRVQAQLARAAAASQAAGTRLRAEVDLLGLAGELEGHAATIEGAETLAAREAASEKLVALRDRTVLALATRPSVDAALAAGIIVALDAQVSSTAVAYTGRQRRVVAGEEAAAEHHGPRSLEVHPLALPSRADRSPAVQALLAASRELFGHPLESTWWVPTVVAHIKANARQIATDITARGAGYPFYTRPGEPASGGHH